MDLNGTLLLLIILGAIVLFFVIREIMTWYWRINEIVDSLDRIDDNLQYITRILKTKNPDAAKKVEDSPVEKD